MMIEKFEISQPAPPNQNFVNWVVTIRRNGGVAGFGVGETSEKATNDALSKIEAIRNPPKRKWTEV